MCKGVGRGAGGLCVCAPYPRVCTRAFVSPPACPLGRLLVWQSDGGVGGCGFSVNDCFAACDGEAVVCGASAVDAGVEGDGCGVALNGGVERVGAGFASCAPVVGVCGGFARVCSRVVVALFDHGLGRVCVSGLFAGVLCAGAGNPRVGDGADGVAVREGDGGGVAASLVVAGLVVEGGVYGDGVCVSRVGGSRLVRVLVVAVAVTLAVVLAWCEGEYAVLRVGDGFANQHVGECLLFSLDPRVDLLLGECDSDGGERLALVAWGGEGAGGDVGVGGADGGGLCFALVEEDERQAGDGARVVGVDV